MPTHQIMHSTTPYSYNKVLLQYYSVYYKGTLIVGLRYIGNVIYNARSNSSHPSTSPNIAPATNDFHHWSVSHMNCNITKCCFCHEKRNSNVTNYCTCHETWLSWLILLAYETSFTMRRATPLTLQGHQILRLPRKMTFQNMKPICYDPTMKLQNWTPPFAELTFSPSATHFVCKSTTFRAPTIYPKFTKCCACHEILRLPRNVTLQHQQMLRLPRKVRLQRHQIVRLPRKAALQHQVLRLFNRTVTWLNCYLTELLLCWVLYMLKSPQLGSFSPKLPLVNLATNQFFCPYLQVESLKSGVRRVPLGTTRTGSVR